MNSGCYGYEISDILSSIKILDRNGEEKEITKDEIEFYRGSNISDEYLILSVKLKGILSSKELIVKKRDEFVKRRNYLNQVELKLEAALLKIIRIKKLGS